MKLLRFCLALALGVPAAPALAQEAVKAQAPEAAPADLADLHAQMKAYGEWLVRLSAVGTGANEELGRIQGEWQAAMKLGSARAAVARFRPVTARARTKVAEARQQLRMLDTPEFPALGLTDDIRTGALVGQMLRLFDRIDALLDSFDSLLDAIVSGNKGTVEASARQMLDAAELVTDTHAILAEAGLATTEKGTGLDDVQLFQARFFRSASRVVAAAKLVLFNRPDPKLAGDLEAYADEFAVIAARGRAALDAQVREWEAAAVDNADEDGVRILRRSIAVIKIDRQVFDVADSYGAALRAGAAKARAGGLVASDIPQILGAYAKGRDAINAVVAAEAAAMAAP